MHLPYEKLRWALRRNPKCLQRGCFPCVGWVKYHWFLEISLGLIFGSDKGKAATERLNPASKPSVHGPWVVASTRLCMEVRPCCTWNMPTNPGISMGSKSGAQAQFLGGQDKGVCVQTCLMALLFVVGCLNLFGWIFAIKKPFTLPGESPLLSEQALCGTS